MAEQLTPMMKQFRDIKAQYPDAMLLFRCGDFYETYCEDAVEASKILNITLTHRNNGGGAAPTEMAGFPFHALDTTCLSWCARGDAWRYATSWKTLN